jgi:hypothetical protein
VEGRFVTHDRHAQGPWIVIVIVKPYADVNLLLVVIVHEVSD